MFNAINGYTGGTTVAAGALAVGDASHADAAINGGAVTVQGGATFGGYGSVKGNVSNAGTLAVADACPAWAAARAPSPSPATWSTAARSTWPGPIRATG